MNNKPRGWRYKALRFMDATGLTPVMGRLLDWGNQHPVLFYTVLLGWVLLVITLAWTTGGPIQP